MLMRNRYRLWFLVMALGVGQTIGVGGVIAQENRGRAYSELSLVKLDREIELRDSEGVFAKYSFKDETCKRPFFFNVHAPDGTLLTRRYPPVEGVDATDHAAMHGGIWLAFGDISGEDFWRNRGRVEHKEFLELESEKEGVLSFKTRSRFVTSEDREIGEAVEHYKVVRMGSSYGMSWDADIRSVQLTGEKGLIFGDQEEMGLGVRMATPLIEKNGGEILNSDGLVKASGTWGKSAKWVDYSKEEGGKRAGVLLIPREENQRSSWFHNRDYGLMVANMFGRKSLTGGESSRMEVREGESLKVGYVVVWYSMNAIEFGQTLGSRRERLESMVKEYRDRLQ